MGSSTISIQPIISSMQKIMMYETKSKYYLLGSNNSNTRFRVLKIDRTEPRELMFVDDKVEYTQDEIYHLVNMIDMGNRPRGQRSGGSGLTKVLSAFGIVGFVRFLEGYYIILITKRCRVAVIGFHTIYKIQDTCMVYIPNDSVRIVHQDEPRYVKMFQSIDLSSNFYFSYSYDLTHSLQYNLTPPVDLNPNYFKQHIPSSKDNETQDSNEEFHIYGVRNEPQTKFVWNSHLLNDVEKELHPDWIIYIIHGFIGQSNMSVFGRSIYVTLIARRSRKYAGTRFLKRGANFDGDVANEVETEQIVYDSSVSSLTQGRYSSFVQMRGSIPAHWSQDITRIVPKPAISIDLNDPFVETAGAHFNELLRRYGSPIIILNLVKKREKKKHESILSEELNEAVKYLNQFLPPDNQIRYISFDMARMNKGKEANVMQKLANIAYEVVANTGIFSNHKPYSTQKENTIIGKSFNSGSNKLFQTGIIRTNCVDCLDRTNTAQFAIGKCALGFQLCALGALESPKLEFDSDCVRMLESLYEDHGDTLALQYGGSQLVHRIKTYRKTAPWTSQGNDIMQTLSRYYSNTFSDAEKQNTINLFLGLFIPNEHSPPIWEQMTDYYLHHRQAVKYVSQLKVPLRDPLSQWWDTEVLEALPNPCNEIRKYCKEIVKIHTRDTEMVDSYIDYHRPDEITLLNDTYAYKISNSIRDFMPNCTVDYSPFTPRVRPGRRREAYKGNVMKNPSLTGQSSTSSAASSSSSEGDSDTSDDDSGLPNDSQNTESKGSCSTSITFESLFPSMSQVYGFELNDPKRFDVSLYKRYVYLGKKANGSLNLKSNVYLAQPLRVQSTFTSDTSIETKPPKVTYESTAIYRQYVMKGKFGAADLKMEESKKYEKYASLNFKWDK